MSKLNKYLSNWAFKLFLKIFQRKSIKQKIHFYEKCKILVIQFGDIQQALTLTPLLKIIENNFNASITILANKNNSQVFANNPFIEYLVLSNEGYKVLTKTLVELKNINFDVIIDAHEILNMEASIYLGLLRTKYKVGFINGNNKLLTHKLPILNANKTHTVDRLLSLTEAFELEANKTNLNIFYQTSDKSQTTIEDYSIKHDLSYKLTALINISNDYKLGFWGIDNYENLIKYLTNYDISIIISASIEDIETAEKIAGKKHLIYYNTDFDIYAELVKNVNFIFTPDSFTTQLAGAYKIPVFCLFVQHKTAEMINVPYNSDFDFALTENSDLKSISYGKVLNSLVPYFEYVYERYQSNNSFR